MYILIGIIGIIIILAAIAPKSYNVSRKIATWGFVGKSAFPMNVFMLFMNMDKAIGKDFEYGLKKLKRILENE